MTSRQDETKIGDQWAIDRLIPYEKNAKKHPKEQIKKLANLIDRVGWRHRIMVDTDGVIIAGHGRLEAAKKLKCKTVPVTVVSDLSEAEIKALRLADNEVVSTEYDVRLLSEELKSLHIDMDFDMSDYFDDRDLNFVTDDPGEIDFDALTDSLSNDVSEHSNETQSRIDGESEKEYHLSKVLSFVKVNAEERRNIMLFQSVAEDYTGLTGAAAFSAYIDNLLTSE